mgnify:CR=1 FL=1
MLFVVLSHVPLESSLLDKMLVMVVPLTLPLLGSYNSDVQRMGGFARLASLWQGCVQKFVGGVLEFMETRGHSHAVVRFPIEYRIEDGGCSSGDLQSFCLMIFYRIPWGAQFSVWRATCLILRVGNGCSKRRRMLFPCFLCLRALQRAKCGYSGCGAIYDVGSRRPLGSWFGEWGV